MSHLTKTSVLNIAIVICGALSLESGALAADDGPDQPAAPVQTSQPAEPVYTPPAQAEQFHHFVNSTFSVEAVVRAAAGAAILQAMNTPGEWGQGAEGYGKRFANDYAQHIVRQTLMYGASDLLGEDNRYFLSDRTGAGSRLGYAVESTFLARTHSGHRRLSYSRIGSIAATAFISREWQPPSTSGASHAGLSIATVFGTEVGFNIAREFLPKVFHTPHLQ